MLNNFRRIAAVACALIATLGAGHASADVKMAYVDALSGGAASAGLLSQKTIQFYVDRINAAGGLNGEKIALSSYDNKTNAQETLIALKKAIDDGNRYVFQGNGSAFAYAILDAVNKHNERNPGKEMVFLNFAAIDPPLTNEKCSFWHFRFDADVDMKMAALTEAVKTDKKIKKIYLLNQDYSFGRSVAAAAEKMLKEKRPDIQVVGNEFVPLQKVQDFSPYAAKIKAAGADGVITGNWGNDMFLLIKAGKDAGYNGIWYTYYAGGLGAPVAIGEAGVGKVKQVSEWHKDVTPQLDPAIVEFEKRFPGQENEYGYWRIKTMMEMFAQAAKKAKANDPIPVSKAMEGLTMQTPLGPVEMRADNHQLLQPLFVSTMSNKVKHPLQGLKIGFVTDMKVDGKATAVPTTCKMQRAS